MSAGIVRILAFLDPAVTSMCHNLDLDVFSFKRLIFFVTYDTPTLCIILASAFFSFFMLDFLTVKKSQVPNSVSYTLWYSFVVSVCALLLILTFIMVSANPTSGSVFSGVYS